MARSAPPEWLCPRCKARHCRSFPSSLAVCAFAWPPSPCPTPCSPETSLRAHGRSLSRFTHFCCRRPCRSPTRTCSELRRSCSAIASFPGTVLVVGGNRGGDGHHAATVSLEMRRDGRFPSDDGQQFRCGHVPTRRAALLPMHLDSQRPPPGRLLPASPSLSLGSTSWCVLPPSHPSRDSLRQERTRRGDSCFIHGRVSRGACRSM